jgi:hypothetical protein
MAHGTHNQLAYLHIFPSRPVVRLDVVSLQNKLIADEFGGYSLEQNPLLAAIVIVVGVAITLGGCRTSSFYSSRHTAPG